MNQLPKNKGLLLIFMERLLGLSVVVFLLGKFAIEWFLSGLNIYDLTEEQSQTWWFIGLVRNLGFWTFSSLLIVIPIIKFRLLKKKVYKWLIAGGILLNLGIIVVLGYMANQTAQTLPLVSELTPEKQKLISKYKDFLEQNEMDLDEQIEATKLMAGSFYRDHGVIVDIIDREGNQTPFVPSKEDIGVRTDMQNADKLIQHTVSSLYTAMTIQITLLFASVILAFTLIKLNTSKQKTPT